MKKTTMTAEGQKWVIIERNDGKFDVTTWDTLGYKMVCKYSGRCQDGHKNHSR